MNYENKKVRIQSRTTRHINNIWMHDNNDTNQILTCWKQIYRNFFPPNSFFFHIDELVYGVIWMHSKYFDVVWFGRFCILQIETMTIKEKMTFVWSCQRSLLLRENRGKSLLRWLLIFWNVKTDAVYKILWEILWYILFLLCER